MTLVTAAVAGDELPSLARSAAEALGCPVAIALPRLGLAARWPADGDADRDGGSEALLDAVNAYGEALIADAEAQAPALLRHALPVRIGPEVIGVAAALTTNGLDPGPWLEAAATAAAVAALMHETSRVDAPGARRAFLQMLELRAPSSADTLLAAARRLGFDLSPGAIGVCGDSERLASLVALAPDALIADVRDGRLLGLLPLERDELWTELTPSQSLILSAPRCDPSALHDALLEAAVLFELLTEPDAHLAAHEDTYRLLVGVLLSNPAELERLRASTIAPIERYDEAHDTDLLATLEAFLAHNGSTTETAEALQLHRHTVGYRLTRAQDVSGLSPYESDGRERLSLGLKAYHIELAAQRRAARRVRD